MSRRILFGGDLALGGLERHGMRRPKVDWTTELDTVSSHPAKRNAINKRHHRNHRLHNI